MANLLILILIDIAALAGMFIYFNRRIARSMEPEIILGKVRDEVNRMILELNQTTDRNVDLIEDRIKTIQDVLNRADKRIAVMNREVERREKESATYAELGRRLSRVQPVERAPEPEVPDVEESRPPAAKEPLPLSRIQPAGGPGTASPAGGTDSEVHGRGVSLPRVSKASEQIDIGRPLPERAVELYRMGFTPELIASRLGRTVGEIELILSLEERKGRENQ